MESSSLFGAGHLFVWFGFGFFCYVIVEDYLPVLHVFVLSCIGMIFCSYYKKIIARSCYLIKRKEK